MPNLLFHRLYNRSLSHPGHYIRSVGQFVRMKMTVPDSIDVSFNRLANQLIWDGAHYLTLSDHRAPILIGSDVASLWLNRREKEIKNKFLYQFELWFDVNLYKDLPICMCVALPWPFGIIKVKRSIGTGYIQ